MKKVLFLIHDLGQGGAEKVLVNLVNHLDLARFDVTVMSLFGGGINEQFLKPEIKYLTVFKKMVPGNTKLMKMFSPNQLHKCFIREKYDIEISYLEGPAARIISGCKDDTTKLVSWIHVEQHTMKQLSASFRSAKEASECYGRFDMTVCVSEYVQDDFCGILDYKKPCRVLYNTVESEMIINKSTEKVNDFSDNRGIRLIAVGTLKVSKGYERLFKVIKKLTLESYSIHLYVLGIGPEKKNLENYIKENGLEKVISLLGYDTNPYKFVKNCDLFVCSSYAEGFSTSATEALIVGTPVCTVEVSGMKEMLGENNEYGIVTENNEEALYQGIKRLLDNPDLLAHYKKQAEIRGRMFNTENTVKAVEEMLLSL
ncbi:MAG: glycosyltransferase [Lachnospiraceae bacterium]|nr:glycosyltransferase [Lachnospiraceae bacterium]